MRIRWGRCNRATATTLTLTLAAVYHLHRRMGGAAHGFIGPPPRLNAETTTMAASAGGPAVIF